MTENDDVIEKPPSRHKEVNVQDVIVVSAGDDGDVWIWKPLQVKQLVFLFQNALVLKKSGLLKNLCRYKEQSNF